MGCQMINQGIRESRMCKKCAKNTLKKIDTWCQHGLTT